MNNDKVTLMFNYLQKGKQCHISKNFQEAVVNYETGLRYGLEIHDSMADGKTKNDLFSQLKFYTNCLERARGHHFEDVIGLEDFKKLFNENIFSVVRNRSLAEEYGVSSTCCILLVGPPGTGKSYSIRAAINEFPEAELIEEKTSNLIDSHIGGTGKNINNLFDRAYEILRQRKDASVVIFIDEIDGIARSRNLDDKGAKEAMGALLVNLTKMDEENANIILICATNTPDQLDKAFMSRFGNNIIEIPLPDKEGRIRILKKNLKKYSPDIDWDTVGKITEGLNGRDLKFIANDANKEAFNKAISGDKLPVTEGILFDIIKLAIERRRTRHNYL